jgi:hypothetical protein
MWNVRVRGCDAVSCLGIVKGVGRKEKVVEEEERGGCLERRLPCSLRSRINPPRERRFSFCVRVLLGQV